MKLISLKLKNIKCYKEESINFKDGINCIFGNNGSGKSTIIECIGYVLFNSIEGKSTDLLRYNEKKGTIELIFEGYDNKIYEIIRTISQSPSTKIIDSESKATLYENVSDVYNFVQKVLNIPKEKNLSKLFNEIIAVPQGSFVSAFLENSAKRKENFDKLFDLDIYKKLSDETKTINDEVKNHYISDLQNKASNLNGELSSFEEVKKNNIGYLNEIKELNEKIEELNKEQTKEKANKDVQDKLKKEYEDLSSLKNKQENEINVIKANLNGLNSQIENAKEANQIILDNEFGYNKYLIAQKEKENLDKKKDKHIKLTKEINEINQEIIKDKTNLENCINSLKEKESELGIAKETKSNQEKDKKTNQKQLDELKPLISKLNERLNEETQKDKDEFSKLNNKKQQLEGYIKTIVTCNVDDIDKIQNQIQNINNKLNNIKNYKDIVNKKHLEIKKLESDSKNLEDNKKFMEGGLCPILKTKCLNIKGESLSEELDSKININTNKINELNKEINNLMPEINDETKLQDDLNQLNISLALKIDSNKRLEDTKAEIEKIFNVKLDEDYQKTFSDLINEVTKEIENYNNEDLENLKNDVSKKNNEIASKDVHIKMLEDSLKDISKNITKLDLDILKSKEKINDLTNHKETLEEKIKKLKLEDDVFYNIDIDIENNKSLLDKFKDNYNMYIENKKLCDGLNELIKKEKKYQEDISNKENELESLEDKLSNNKYNEEEYNKINEILKSIETKIASSSVLLKEKEKQYKDNLKKLEILEVKYKELEKVSNEINKYEILSKKLCFYRTIFDNIPKELSEQIRNYISIYATQYYQNISGESIKITISDDYEVSIIDLNDETKIKHMKQLSGGEQMSVAISIRLAMLKQITKIDFYFMDEPTINLDKDRRDKVGEVVRDISTKLRQIFVISHDDTFDSITNNTIKILKTDNVSNLEKS